MRQPQQTTRLTVMRYLIVEAIKRELENAYKQVAMYKKQLMNLKSKEETEASFDKLKDL